MKWGGRPERDGGEKKFSLLLLPRYPGMVYTRVTVCFPRLVIGQRCKALVGGGPGNKRALCGLDTPGNMGHAG